MNDSRCKHCLWWDNQHKRIGKLRAEGFGYCRKHKPVVFLANDAYYGGWPLVDQEDLCGEFHPQKAA